MGHFTRGRRKCGETVPIPGADTGAHVRPLKNKKYFSFILDAASLRSSSITYFLNLCMLKKLKKNLKIVTSLVANEWSRISFQASHRRNTNTDEEDEDLGDILLNSPEVCHLRPSNNKKSTPRNIKNNYHSHAGYTCLTLTLGRRLANGFLS